jgi:hypothetical protein
MTQPGSRRLALLGGLLLAVGLAGCSGNQRLTIQGTVSYQGRPVPSGVVKFHGPGDRVSMATLEKDGTFTITDVSPGEVKVTVEEDPAARMKESMTGAGDEQPSADGKEAAVPPISIPPRYWKVSTSGLVYTITSGTDRLDVKLE